MEHPQAPQVGFSFVLRAEDGVLVAAKNGRLESPADTLTAKALGCREALVWIQRYGLRNVTVVSDSLIW